MQCYEVATYVSSKHASIHASLVTKVEVSEVSTFFHHFEFCMEVKRAQRVILWFFGTQSFLNWLFN